MLVRHRPARLRDRGGAGGGRPRGERGHGARGAHGRADDHARCPRSQEAAAASDSRAPRRASLAARRALREAEAARRQRPGRTWSGSSPCSPRTRSRSQEYDAAGRARRKPRARRASRPRPRCARPRSRWRRPRRALAQARTGPEQVAMRRRAPTRRRPRWSRRGPRSRQARLDLELHRDRRPPVGGVVSRRTVEVGPGGAARPAAAGRRAARATSGSIANYKENQLKRIRARPAGAVARGRLRRPPVPRQGGQHRGGHRRALQPAAAGERDAATT